jgi:hypothetical protein
LKFGRILLLFSQHEFGIQSVSLALRFLENQSRLDSGICVFFTRILTALHMGLAPCGQMRQEIYSDHFGFDAWDRSHSSRCFVHLCNSLVWQSITGQHPLYPPPTAKSYSEAGLPWFDYYRDDVEALPGSDTLAELKSVSQISQTKGDHALPENEPVTQPPTQIRQLGKGRLVREMK